MGVWAKGAELRRIMLVNWHNMPIVALMDAIDARIIRALQRDGRLTNLELAEEVGLSPSPCLRRVRNLEAAGVIQGYTALVDQKACGYPITCLVRIRLANHSQENVQAFEKKIAETDAILDCYLMTGGPIMSCESLPAASTITSSWCATRSRNCPESPRSRPVSPMAW